MTSLFGLITNRSNDLDSFFFPLIYFIKDQILRYHVIPLWNPMILSGTPLLPDPQSTLFYLPNVLFLLLPINTGFIFIITLHAVLSALGIKLISKLLKLSKLATIFTLIVYIFSPKLFGLLEAGHYGLIISYYLLPWVAFCLFSLSKKFNKKIFILLIITLLAIFLNHVLTFFITAIGLMVFNLFMFWQTSEKKYLLIIFFGLLATMGLGAFVLFPQLEWTKYTNRSLLITNPDVYPKWNGLRDFLIDMFVPWLLGKNYLWNIDSEKWLTGGLMINLLAIIGYINLKKSLKLTILFVSIFTISICLNNISPFYELLIHFPPYLLLRVSTRFWLPFYLILILLAGFGLNKITFQNKRLAYLLFGMGLIEVFSLSFLRISKPVVYPLTVPQGVYSFLGQDKSTYRIFCITDCIPQKEAAMHSLELIEGYSTLIQTNYNREAWQFTGQFWNYYSLSVPPSGIIQFTKIKPNPYALGLYNTKYIISPYSLDDPHLRLLNNLSGYLIYLNQDFLPRAYFWNNHSFEGEAPILNSSPNLIRVDVKNDGLKHLILSQTFNNGWKAYLNGTKEVTIQETPEGLSSIDLDSSVSFVEFKYQPESLKTGSIISTTTLGILILWLAL